MGKHIEKNAEGLYKVQNTNTDTYYFDGKWVTENEVKKLLIEEKIWKFLEDIAEVEIDFPNYQVIDGKFITNPNHVSYKEQWLKASKPSNRKGKLEEFIYKNAINAIKKHNLDEFINPLVK